MVNYGNRQGCFSEVELADCGGTVSIESEFARGGVPTGTSLFRAPEVHLEMPWGTAADIWSFGVTVSILLALDFFNKTNSYLAHKLDMGPQLPYI